MFPSGCRRPVAEPEVDALTWGTEDVKSHAPKNLQEVPSQMNACSSPEMPNASSLSTTFLAWSSAGRLNGNFTTSFAAASCPANHAWSVTAPPATAPPNAKIRCWPWSPIMANPVRADGAITLAVESRASCRQVLEPKSHSQRSFWTPFASVPPWMASLPWVQMAPPAPARGVGNPAPTPPMDNCVQLVVVVQAAGGMAADGGHVIVAFHTSFISAGVPAFVLRPPNR